MKTKLWILVLSLSAMSMAYSQNSDNQTPPASSNGDDIYYSNQSPASSTPPGYNDYYHDNNQPANSNTQVNPNESLADNGDGNNQDDNNQAYANNDNNGGGYINNNQANNNPEPLQNQNPDYQNFHNQLSPYGHWMNYSNYGNVWVPNNVPTDFSPYLSGGHWAYTEYGWTWVSDYAWGTIPFHYGRWFYETAYGWMWMPGYDWAPAWVVWGSYGNYYGWAPCAPFRDFAYYAHYRPAYRYWNFIGSGYIGCAHPYNYIVNHNEYFRNHFAEIDRHINVIGHAGAYNNRQFFSGPRAEEVERNSGQRVERNSINTINHAAPVHSSAGQSYRSNNNINHTGQPSLVNRNVNAQNRQASVNRPQQPSYNNANRASVAPNQRAYTQNNYNRQPAQQHFSQPPVRNYGGTQSAHNSYQPVQRNTERSFASAQRPSYHSSGSQVHSSGGGGHISAGHSSGGRRR